MRKHKWCSVDGLLKESMDRLLARAAQKRVRLFSGGYRAATARERCRGTLFQHRAEAGLTLIEMLVVVTILGLFLSYVGLKYWKHVDEARVTTARAQMNAFKDALLTFKMAHGNFPNTEQGLAALREELSGDIPLDPWGHPYVYKYPGEHGEEPEIICYGADGQPGGEGINADIVSWKSQ